jgi:hypothetical protein
MSGTHRNAPNEMLHRIANAPGELHVIDCFE